MTERNYNHEPPPVHPRPFTVALWALGAVGMFWWGIPAIADLLLWIGGGA